MGASGTVLVRKPAMPVPAWYNQAEFNRGLELKAFSSLAFSRRNLA
jgi:hypothetical protein